MYIYPFLYIFNPVIYILPSLLYFLIQLLILYHPNFHKFNVLFYWVYIFISFILDITCFITDFFFKSSIFFLTLWPHPWYVEVPRPGILSKLQLQHILQLQQHWILEPTAPSLGSNPYLSSDSSCCSQIHNTLCHSRNS